MASVAMSCPEDMEAILITNDQIAIGRKDRPFGKPAHEHTLVKVMKGQQHPF